MNTRLRRDARLLMLFAVLAALPLAIWACGDAGDGPGNPTGPGSTYNPNIDYPGATITTSVRPSTVTPGDTFGILVTFKDANGLPVEGVPLSISAEHGGAPYFSAGSNPTLTDENGNASIHVFVNAGCPNGSYTFVIFTQRAWSARGYAEVKVTGATGGGSVTAVSLSGNATPTVGVGATYQASVTATCDYELEFQFTDTPGAWYPAGDVLYTYVWTAAGDYSAYAHARCVGSTGAWTLSNALAVTVAP